jgi:hypothetical protein
MAMAMAMAMALAMALAMAGAMALALAMAMAGAMAGAMALAMAMTLALALALGWAIGTVEAFGNGSCDSYTVLRQQGGDVSKFKKFKFIGDDKVPQYGLVDVELQKKQGKVVEAHVLSLLREGLPEYDWMPRMQTRASGAGPIRVGMGGVCGTCEIYVDVSAYTSVEEDPTQMEVTGIAGVYLMTPGNISLRLPCEHSLPDVVDGIKNGFKAAKALAEASP